MSTTQQPQFSLAVTLTETAAQQVRSFIEQEEGVSPETGGLRISVLPGGCSGFKYGLSIEDAPADDDIVAEVQGIRVFVDSFSAQYLNGVTIGYHSSMQGAGFTFENPNATGGCGCGSSFTA
jgi:iron-sulfur cluster assembly protein